MKTKKSIQANAATISVAALLTLQTLPKVLNAQIGASHNIPSTKVDLNPFLKINLKELSQQKMSLVGILKGEPLFKNGKGEFFVVNINSGNIEIVNHEDYNKMAPFEKQMVNKGYFIKLATLKNSLKEVKGSVTQKGRESINEIKILGIDKDGHVIQETSKGEKFFLDPSTGDMIDYVGHVTLLR